MYRRSGFRDRGVAGLGRVNLSFLGVEGAESSGIELEATCYTIACQTSILYFGDHLENLPQWRQHSCRFPHAWIPP